MAVEKKSAGLGKSSILIIVVGGVERFAYKGVASNLVTYLTDVVNLSTSSAAKIVSTWSGVTWILPLVTAVLVDSYWDRYSTITSSSLIYITGFVGLASWASLYAWMPTLSLFVPLFLISIGQGGYNSSLQAFGVDQLDTEDDHLPCCNEEDDKMNKKSKFFHWWYFAICGGSLLGNTIMSYVQDTYGWGVGFAIPAISMSLSVGGFFCGAQFYVHKQPKLNHRRVESVIRAIKVTARSIATRKFDLPSREDDLVELELQEKPLKDEYKSSKATDCSITTVDEQPGVTAVILRLLPIWMTLLMFAVIFQQPTTLFTKQGMVMKHNIGTAFIIPPAMLQSAINIAVLLLMPLYTKLTRAITQDNKGISILQRIGTGMFISIIALSIAAVVEAERLERKELSIFWLLPQYILLGVSDVFTVVGMQEFFYAQVPSTMKTIGISLNACVFGVGGFLNAGLISVIELLGGDHGWFSDDMSVARLDKYYWFLALLSTELRGFACIGALTMQALQCYPLAQRAQ